MHQPGITSSSIQPTPPEAKKVFSGVIFDVYQWEQELFDGTKAIFEKLKRADTVLIIPVTRDKKIIITEQEQPGKLQFMSFAGGRIEESESVLEAAKRELLEETGYEAQQFVEWDSVQPVSKIDWTVHTLIAKGCEKVQDPHPEAGERIKVEVISFDEFIKRASHENFHETSITIRVLQAKLDSKKMINLKKALLS